jgi:hypothetical protein
MGWEGVLGGLGIAAACLVGLLAIAALSAMLFALLKLAVIIKYALQKDEPQGGGSYTLEQSRGADEREQDQP